MTTTNSQAAEIDPQHVIKVLLDENKQINENRLYLLALISQIQAEFADAQETWNLERESLKSKDVN